MKEQSIARICKTSRTAFDKDGNPYLAPDLGVLPYFKRGNLVGKSHGDLETVKKTVAADQRLAHSVATTSESGVEAGAHMGNRAIVEFLLENGAAYSLPTAVMLNDFTTVRKLLDEDPQRINERGAHDFPLLVYPIIGKCGPDMMALLLERGAEVEAQHFLGTTALHWACMRGRLKVVTLLFYFAALRPDAGPEIVEAPKVRVAIMPFAPQDAGNPFYGNDIAFNLLEYLNDHDGARYALIGPTTTVDFTKGNLRQLINQYQIDGLVNGKFLEREGTQRLLVEVIRTTDGAHVWVKSYSVTADQDFMQLAIGEALREEFD